MEKYGQEDVGRHKYYMGDYVEIVAPNACGRYGERYGTPVKIIATTSKGYHGKLLGGKYHDTWLYDESDLGKKLTWEEAIERLRRFRKTTWGL
jgi:hypothetical protein